MVNKKLSQEEITLAVMAAGEIGAHFSPVQIQKILFLVDEEIPGLVGGPLFDFQPYNYGPFDSKVYQVLDDLDEKGNVQVVPKRRYQSYVLALQGKEIGQEILSSLDVDAREFIRDAVKWALDLRFDELVSSIYKRYPKMKKRSVFQA